MTAQGEDLLAWLNDGALCPARYPGGDSNPYDFGSLCNLESGHAGSHRALAEVAGDYRRHIVWTVDGKVLPDEKSSRDQPQQEGER